MKPRRLWVYILWCAGMLFCATHGWGMSEDELQTQIEQTKKKLSETKRKENSVLGSLLRTQQELEKISANLANFNYKIDATERRMELITSQLNTVQAELDTLREEIKGRKEVLDQRVVAIYKYGYQSYLEIMFNAKNFAEFLARFEMVSSFVRGDLQILHSLQQQQELVDKKRAEILEKKEELASQKDLYAQLQVQNKREQSRQISFIQSKQKELYTLQNDRKALEDALDELEKTSKEIEAQIRQYQNKNQVALGTGKYIWPAPGDVRSYFGNRFHPILKKRKYHAGIDIASPSGTDIVASDTGEIIFAGRNGGYGKMVIIDHGAGFSSVYAHCSLLLVDTGQSVTKGQVIAKVGSTGLSTGPHLHFEIRKNGTPVDPMSFL